MQGDIFQLEQMASQADAAAFKPNAVSRDSEAGPQVAIYNEDDLSHLLYVNHLHHNGQKDRVIVNHVYRDGYSTPLESPLNGTQTPASETNETPVLSDCESDFDEGVCLSPSPSLPGTYSWRNPLRFEDGFEFPVFLGRQAEEMSHPAARSGSESGRSADLSRQRKQVRIAAPEDNHVSDISGPLMSWWPAPLELIEHEWVEEKAAESKASETPQRQQHVSSIDGPLMSWWPLPIELSQYQWDERFYE